MTQRDDSGSQLLVPEAFVRLYSSPGGRLRPGIDRHTLAERHEYCEDLAAALAEQAATIAWRQGLSPDVVLDRIEIGRAHV
jgi:hypothetical protein